MKTCLIFFILRQRYTDLQFLTYQILQTQSLKTPSVPKLWRNKDSYILHGSTDRSQLVIFTKITNIFTSVSAILHTFENLSQEKTARIYPTDTLVP